MFVIYALLLRVEAIKIELIGKIAKYFDIYELIVRTMIGQAEQKNSKPAGTAG